MPLMPGDKNWQGLGSLLHRTGYPPSDVDEQEEGVEEEASPKLLIKNS